MFTPLPTKLSTSLRKIRSQCLKVPRNPEVLLKAHLHYAQAHPSVRVLRRSWREPYCLRIRITRCWGFPNPPTWITPCSNVSAEVVGVSFLQPQEVTPFSISDAPSLPGRGSEIKSDSSLIRMRVKNRSWRKFARLSTLHRFIRGQNQVKKEETSRALIHATKADRNLEPWVPRPKCQDCTTFLITVEPSYRSILRPPEHSRSPWGIQQ